MQNSKTQKTNYEFSEEELKNLVNFFVTLKKIDQRIRAEKKNANTPPLCQKPKTTKKSKKI